MSPQQTIAHYCITAKMGEGGMGEVWRATDTKLGREVAIKILPAAFADDTDRLARFQRVHGELTGSSGYRSLVQASTVPPPPVRTETSW